MSHKFFENKKCTFYPCHSNIEEINCMFCYCPLFHENHCKGKYKYIFINSRQIKDCSACNYPHSRDNYEKIIFRLRD